VLSELGWDESWANALARLPDSPDASPARVTAVHRGRVHVVGDGLDEVVSFAATLPAQPAVGDWVVYDGRKVSDILPRRTELARAGSVLAANVDLGVVVASCHEDLNARRLERFIALVSGGGIEPLVILSKGDLSADPEREAADARARTGTDTLIVSARAGWGIEEVRERLLPRRTAVLVGMSGVGKSTLLNALLGEERQRTLPVRERDGTGRHATVHRELFRLASGALIIDTPGVRRPELASGAGVEDTFADIEELARGCRFSDCRHEDEPGCAVRGVVSAERLESMRKLQREGREATERGAARRRPRRG
jgi:ribosome biogenesis GTPase